MEQQLQRFADVGVTELWPALYPVGRRRRRRASGAPARCWRAWPGDRALRRGAGRGRVRRRGGRRPAAARRAQRRRPGARAGAARARRWSPTRRPAGCSGCCWTRSPRRWPSSATTRAHGEVYNCRERRFAARIGHDAGWLHAGRPRREAVRIALRLRVRRDARRPDRGGGASSPPRPPRVADGARRDRDGRADLPAARPALDVRALPAGLRSTRCCATSTGSPRTWTGSTAARPAPAGSTAARSPATGSGWPTCSASTASSSTPATRCGRPTASPRWSRRPPAWSPRWPSSPRTWRSTAAREFGYVSLAAGHTRSSVLHAAEAQPVRADHGARRGRRPHRTGHRDARAGQEPVGAQRQPDLRLRRGAAGAGPGHPGDPADGRRGRRADRATPTGCTPRWRPVSRRPPTWPSTSWSPPGWTTARPTTWSAACVRRAAAAGLRGVDITGAMLDEVAAELAAADPNRAPTPAFARNRSVRRARSAGDRALPELPRRCRPRRRAGHGRGLSGCGGHRAGRGAGPARRLRAGRGRGAAPRHRGHPMTIPQRHRNPRQ